jgi:hypothetical protein
MPQVAPLACGLLGLLLLVMPQQAKAFDCEHLLGGRRTFIHG